jgi:putative membrane protein
MSRLKTTGPHRPQENPEATSATTRHTGQHASEVFTMMYWGNGIGGWGYVLMTVSMLLFWGLLIAGVVLLVRYVGGDRRQPPSPTAGPDPRSLLAERFARGEINEDDYRQRLKVLSGV